MYRCEQGCRCGLKDGILAEDHCSGKSYGFPHTTSFIPFIPTLSLPLPQVLQQKQLTPSQLVMLLRRLTDLDHVKQYAKYGDSDFLEFVDQVGSTVHHARAVHRLGGHLVGVGRCTYIGGSSNIWIREPGEEGGRHAS